MDSVKEGLVAKFKSAPHPLPMEAGIILEKDLNRICMEIRSIVIEGLTGLRRNETDP